MTSAVLALFPTAKEVTKDLIKVVFSNFTATTLATLSEQELRAIIDKQVCQ